MGGEPRRARHGWSNPVERFTDPSGADFRNARELAQIITAESGYLVTASQVAFAGTVDGGGVPSEEDDHHHDAMVRLFDHYGRYGITGNSNVLGWLLGRPPTSFAAYVRRNLVSP